MLPRRIPQTDATRDDLLEAHRAILRYELPPRASPRSRADLEQVKRDALAEILHALRVRPRCYKFKPPRR